MAKTSKREQARKKRPKTASKSASKEALPEIPSPEETTPEETPESRASAPEAESQGESEAQPPVAPKGTEDASELPRPHVHTSVRPDERDAIHDAVLFESKEHGFSHGDAMSFAENVCDRLQHRMHSGGLTTLIAEDGPTLLDLRHKQDYIYPGNKRKVRTVDRQNSVPLMRKPSDINAIVIHQTACEFGVSKRAISQHGNSEVARAHRALDVACHVLAFRNGYYVAAHDLRVHVNHANRLNDRSLGLEIEGRYPGLMDDPGTMAREDLRTTWGGEPTELTDTVVSTAMAALKWMVEEAARYGMKIEYVFAHRQSNDNRRSDPGEEIWRRVVLEYAVPALGLKTQPETPWQQGYSIPVEWDTAGVGNY